MPREPQRPKARYVTDASFAAVVRDFLVSPKWVNPAPIGYAESTKKLWRRELNFMARPDVLGAISIDEIRPALVQAFFDGIAHTPGRQHYAMRALKQLERWAIVRDVLPREVTLGVEIGHSEGGHEPWSDEHVALAERHARPDLARAVTLAANTGQRGSDLVRIGPTFVEVYQGIPGLNVVQIKTGRQVWIPITADLSAAMERWERRPGPYLTKADGSPWTRKELTEAWSYERKSNPHLKPILEAGLVLHGLRATACVRLRRAAATIPQIADTVGMSEAMVARYCRFSIQKENAVAAIHHLERNRRERTAG